MIFTILSSFDNRLGPKIFIKIPNSGSVPYFNEIPLLMDFYKRGFFVHEFNNIKTANLIFDIYSPCARGKREMLMISIVLYQEKINIDLNSFKEILEFFAMQITQIEDIYKGFYFEEINEGKEKLKEIVNLVRSLNNSIPSEHHISDRFFKKILTLKLTFEGKSAIIENFKRQLNFNIELPKNNKEFPAFSI
ncbi:MAG: hypothetical protein ACTSVV_15440 [Promethearchaeota archaeon]